PRGSSFPRPIAPSFDSTLGSSIRISTRRSVDPTLPCDSPRLRTRHGEVDSSASSSLGVLERKKQNCNREVRARSRNRHPRGEGTGEAAGPFPPDGAPTRARWALPRTSATIIHDHQRLPRCGVFNTPSMRAIPQVTSTGGSGSESIGFAKLLIDQLD